MNEYIVHFILQGEPKSNPEECMEPSMSVLIVPMAIEAHPSSRTPLKPSSPLPWNDCHYLPCFFFATLRSPTTFITEPIKWQVDREGRGRKRRFLSADVERQKELARMKSNALSAVSTTAP
jgi:hypothetical protein